MSSIWDVQPICDKGVVNYFGVPTFFLNLSCPLPSLLLISQNKFSITPERTAFSVVCMCRLGEQKQQHCFFLFFFLERKSELRENNLVYCVWMRVLFHQLLTNRFTMIKAALHSALQRLLSMEELIYLPVIYIWWFNIGTKCQNKRRSKKKLLSDIKASQSHVIYILPPTGRNKRKIPPNNYMDLESQRVFAFDSTIDATLD